MLALTISSGISKSAFAASDNPQFQIGDKVSIFSDKAYRKNEGRYFEAVGNVVIISQKDTIYGELASLDQDTLMVKIEGNVRVITKDMTLYGSHLEYSIATGAATIRNARILTPDFNLVASVLQRFSEVDYLAKDAEFTTCKDCAESWSIFGKTIKLRVGKYVQVSHGLAKVKGVNILYVPYIVLPILGKRKTGLLFPNFSTRIGEGLAFEQPVFVEMGPHKDMTFSPTFWAKRGYGGDVQYRHRFKDLTWLEVNARVLNDTIYEPGKTSQSLSGEEFFRYFFEAESHQQWSPDFNSHFRYTSTRDLDMVVDHQQYIDQKNLSSDFGLRSQANWRQDLFSLGAEANYLRNELYNDPLSFDRGYVQVMPRLTLSTVPHTVYQSRIPGLQHIAVGLGSSYTRFRQVNEDDTTVIRNADRLSAQPYINWNLFTIGPVGVKTRYMLDQQTYQFTNADEENFGKNAGLMQTEFSFTMDKIFGLAYEEKIPIRAIPEKELKELRERKEQGLKPLQQTEKKNRLIGEIPEFEADLVQENVTQVRKSYRHSQEFKLIHHYITGENEYGNERFLAQIRASQAGLFDFEDAIRREEFKFGSQSTSTIIPPTNTMEFQWNNTLIRKTPKPFNFLDDDKYLRDNFNYTRLGYFNVSQGYLLDPQESDNYLNRLTRLMILTGYNADKWSANLNEYYFYERRQHVFNVNLTRKFEFINVFGDYRYDPSGASFINVLNFGGQVRPTDVLGLAMVKSLDLDANKNMRTIYSVDIMPNNNCWILNLNYRQSLNVDRYSFNVIFNFGDDSFDRYRTDYFASKRL